MTKRVSNTKPTEMKKPEPPSCPPTPPSREFICNIFGFTESKESISKREEYMKSKKCVTDKLDIKQLFKFYGIEHDEPCYDLDIYIANLEQLVNIQAQQIERLQNRLREIEPQRPMNEHHKIRIA